MHWRESLILIVDDDHANRQTVYQFLDDKRTKFMQAADGKTACDLAAQNLPDLIIMDWDMPIMNGLEATKKLKGSEPTRDIPIIMATGAMTSASNLDLAFEAGVIDFLKKPLNPIELQARSRSILALSKSYQKIREQNQKLTELNSIIEEQNKQILKASELKESIARAQQEQLEKDLDLQNRSILSQEVFINQKNKILSQIVEELRVLQVMEDLYGLKNRISKLINNTEKQISLEQDWESFKTHFEKIHPDFFTNLLKKHPGLTNLELKHCAFIRLNLGSQEVASLLFIEPKSVNMIRYRIGRRLNLSKGEKLRVYLSSF